MNTTFRPTLGHLWGIRKHGNSIWFHFGRLDIGICIRYWGKP